MFLVNRFTCRANQVRKIANTLKKQNYKPIIAKINENPKSRMSNFYELKDLVNQNPNNTFAIKLSGFDIDNHYETTYDMTDELIQIAIEKDSRIIIDAEYAYQHLPIMEITDEMMAKYNTDFPIVFKTYQMYRKDSLDMLSNDLGASRQHYLGAKLVRGAYHTIDVGTGQLYTKLKDTHDNYNKGFNTFIEKCKENDEVICATHNYDSIGFAKDMIGLYNLHNVSFAYLMGMSDNVSKKMADKEYTVYKYLPYGDFMESIPYLMRRLYENYPMTGKLFH